ncbi:pentatricopeptide repeat-containing protein At5g06540 isoform X2 [Daucus carota subsp. sativus]|uniref:pentatricopeptide repeat-containing protein At5g06540 isoform X2 n=1 Tax=Daucus carota subsp. sativus TaxID=79200 RepID=UPI0007EF7188|nr:PREDICTED: pentatricopeptide repeat-containing protein At5g06540-like isoform X2 [Daucus carota subsp. sativus]
MFQKTVTTYRNTSIASLSKTCKTLNQLKQIHAYLLKSILHETPFAIGPILSVAATSKDDTFFTYANAIFRNLILRNTFMFNTMIRGNVERNRPVPAILCYKEMLNCGFLANNYTFTPLIKACSMLDCRKIGFLVHAHVVVLGFCGDPFVGSALIEFYSSDLDLRLARVLFDGMPRRDVVLWTVMIDGYGKMGDVENARALFDEMPERNVIAWSTMMAAYSRVSEYKEVISLYSLMQREGVRPNESVLVSVTTACANLGALAQGMWIHSFAKQNKLDSNPILATALVDMYSKCGYLELALSVFESIAAKDSASWNAIISGVAINGEAIMSLELFNKMVKAEVQPNDTTFVAVFTACTHARLVNKGLELFEQMNSLYGVEPKYEHHACMVDLLARAGRLEEAKTFIDNRMGGIGEGDANVWGALLNACRIYGNVEIGDEVWKRLANMRVSDSGTHVLSYNIYKEAGWENEAKGVRKLISESRIKKTPGCSVLEVDGMVEEFVAAI